MEVRRLTNMTRVLDHQRARLEQIGSDVGRNLAILKERIWQAREQAKNVSRCGCVCVHVYVCVCPCIFVCTNVNLITEQLSNKVSITVDFTIFYYSDLYSFGDRIDIVYWWTFKYRLHFLVMHFRM